MIGMKTEREAKGGAAALGFLLAALMVMMLFAAKPAHAKTLRRHRITSKNSIGSLEHFVGPARLTL
jgi:hypothetical protein